MKKKDAIKRLAEIKKEIPELEKIIGSDDPLDITTYKEVCEKLNENEITEDNVKFLPIGDRKKAIAKLRIGQLEKFYNGNSKNNYYYPYFNRTGHGGLGFNFSCYYVGVIFHGQVGLYKDQETADHVGRNHIDVYKDLI